MLFILRLNFGSLQSRLGNVIVQLTTMYCYTVKWIFLSDSWMNLITGKLKEFSYEWLNESYYQIVEWILLPPEWMNLHIE